MPNHVFTVKDMTCQGCAGKIRSALESNDRISNVDISVEKKSITLASDSDWENIAHIIREAGYSPESAVKKQSLFGRIFG